MRLAGKVALVTGGAMGIGQAIARRFAAEGAAVIVADINEEAAQTTVAEISGAGGEVQFIPADVSNREQVDVLFDATLDAYRQLDVLVNNAGIGHGPRAVQHFLETPQEMWRTLMAVHLDGMYYCSQRAARIMAKQGRGGCIINMSSGGATQAHRHMVAYDTTKGGIEAFTRALALDLAPWKIRVNALAPGVIWVESRVPIGEESAIDPGDIVPWGRLGVADDVAGPAVFLASDDAEYVTGHVLAVDGGLTAQLRSPMIDIQTDLGLAERV